MPFKLANIDGRAALVDRDHYFDLETISRGAFSSDVMEALSDTSKLAECDATLSDHTPTGPLSKAHLSPTVPRPNNCFAVGLNYRNHAEESKMDIPRVPLVFTKYPSCLAGAHDDIVMRSDYVDFEAELVVVIGRQGKDIDPADAWSYVAGLTIGQDISDRPAQFGASPPQFNLGKSFDTFGPIGPFIVSPDGLTDPSSLAIECQVNDEIRQKDNTGDLIFDIPALVAYLSEICTLQVGDLIFTGTPGGVGVAEGRFLKDGDVIRTSIEGIGTLVNKCVRGPDHTNADFVPPPMQKIIDARQNSKD